MPAGIGYLQSEAKIEPEGEKGSRSFSMTSLQYELNRGRLAEWREKRGYCDLPYFFDRSTKLIVLYWKRREIFPSKRSLFF